MTPDGEVGPSAAAAIMAKLGEVSTNIAVMQNDVGYLKTQSAENAKSIGRALDGLATVSSDAAQSPAGRELLRRVTAAELADAAAVERLDALEDFRDEMKAAMRLLRAEATFATAIGTIVTIIWTGHSLGWW